jgi:hypothetical protein
MGKTPIFFMLISILSISGFLLRNNAKAQKKIIEFGWDYPKVGFLKTHLESMQKLPFDGVVFSFDFDIYNAFDSSNYSEANFQYNELAGLNWGNFTDNFLLVRGAGYTGAHWLDDATWIKIVNNLKLVSKALNASKAKGIGFDPEYYYKDSTLNPWLYRASWYKNLSYIQVGAYVKKRGKQFIQALQSSKPDLKILCFWLLELVDVQSKTQALAETGMALYPFFVEGMLEGQNKYSEIIDGNEGSYGFDKAEQFVESGYSQRQTGSKFLTTSLQSKYKKIGIAQAVYFDLIYGKTPALDKGYDQQTKEQWLRQNLYAAFKSTDKYVWFYNERVNWWTNSIDSGVADIIKSVKNQINKESENKSNIITGKSSISLLNTFSSNITQPKSNNNMAFDFIFSKMKRRLQITFSNKKITNVRLYKNSRLIYNADNPSKNMTIDLTGKYDNQGSLIILARDEKGQVFIAYVN